MSKKRKDRKRLKKRKPSIPLSSNITSEPKELTELEKRAVLRDAQHNLVLLLLLLPIIFTEMSIVSDKLLEVKDPHLINLFKIADIFQVTVIVTMVYVTWKHRKFKGGDVRRTRRISSTILALNTGLLAIGTFELLYVYEFPALVSSFISTYIPKVGHKMNKVTSAFVTFMTSGLSGIAGAILLNILANILYDKFIKPSLLRKGILKT